ncbi:LRR receptor-like serine/threonine-protein kinase [Hirschfeldia incana]|nr:LRR receptor-like serine/threonine-protein kinase [Hirschfeldia incana]
MESLQGLLLALILVAFGATTHLIQAQPDPNEFISLDCGLHPAASPYTEPLTKLTYTSDANFTQGGQSGRVKKSSEQDYKPFTVLRYFPEGIRNCYNLKVTSGTKYLIRALFLYGDYDGLGHAPKFDLYLGPNIWTTVDLTRSLGEEKNEIIHIPKLNSLQICLVKTGKTTPIISALELRPLRDDIYSTTSGSLKLLKREFASDDRPFFIRYPADVYDREWTQMINFLSVFNFVNTSLNVNSSIPYELPQEVISKAAINKNVTETLTYEWVMDEREDQALIYLHFAEIQSLRGNDTREFDITWKGNDENFTVSAYRPQKSQLETLYNPSPMKCRFLACTVELVMTKSSTLPPMINAMEAYKIIEFPDAETNPEDVAAVQNVRDAYEISRFDWQGDPCVPRIFKWEGINCSYTNTTISPRIISLDLSSSGLEGLISSSIQNLTHLQELDLSNNNLSGEVPEFLANMESLLLINLGWNSLTGPIPQALREREKRGLKLTFHGNPNLCLSDSCNNDKKKVLVPVIASVASIVALIALLALFFVFRKKAPLSEGATATRELPRKSSIYSKKKRLKIAVEAAQGLEYLHVGCEPPMVHRDVKSTNILLDDRFEAKLADFGLSRSFCVGAETQVATVVAGTPGYLDPEYYQTNWLNEKSDVYSFGIVLMEIITNRSVIELTREKAHIAEWVKILISIGDLEKIVDSNLGGDYDSNTVWKILELAMSCVSQSSSDRPTMSRVVNVLKECLISENSRMGGQVQDDESKNSLELTVDFGTQVTPDAR